MLPTSVRVCSSTARVVSWERCNAPSHDALHSLFSVLAVAPKNEVKEGLCLNGGHEM